MNKINAFFIFSIAAFSLCETSLAQHSHGATDYAPAEVFSNLPAPKRMTGIGTATIKVTTKSADAQAFFDQGLNLLHAYWDMESYRAFREAARLDPNCAMAWWGIYNALGQNSQEMATERRMALTKAAELMPAASDHEQFYLRAISLQADPAKGRAAWTSEMESLINKYPDDVEAKLLLANSLSSSASSYLPDGRPRDGKMYGRAILENLLKTHPEHAAVHHYWIHAVENGPRPEEALASAEKLIKLAPNSGHMLHMPGHIYYRLGMYEKARTAFLASYEFDRKYMRENNINPINNWNFIHNLDYLVANCAEEGRFREAMDYAKMLAEIPADENRIKSTGLGYIHFGGETATARVLMRYGKWSEAVTEVEKMRKDVTTGPSAQYLDGLLAYLKGMNAVDAGKPDEADASTAAIQKAADEMAATRSPNASDWYAGYAARVLAVHLLDLRGSIASVRGQNDEAVKILSDAANRERDLGYWEPPHYTRPVFESLAAALIRAGRYSEAADAFERMLNLRKNSGFAYSGMVKAFEKTGDKVKAADAKLRLAAAWKNADAGLVLAKIVAH